ncbi:DUF4922 domain-containing protein [Muribaculum sp. NM65_B17]|uniref:DUF4922 domain-containing protein n=2 Tax=Muribaculum TaxID=1918540 RepID=UPI001093FBC8|nr:DUF4922 domain-containing protein [Muribaculum sp. NM65_B17]TGY02130.1 DUF4922 domain-containing protein [Muribaculum sp. NM65_B17]THG44424.1 DUF4922 domain-containing protein [Muribaculaceae bacterium]
MKRDAIDRLVEDQLRDWEEVRLRTMSLRDVKVKDVTVDGVPWRAQFNPARVVSTGAKVDKASIAARPCFLCRDNRPQCQHVHQWGNYEILVNPFPIFPGHLTIASCRHEPQSVNGHVGDMLRLACELEGYTVFYNGPQCGASAPDHLHFQAVPSEYMPLDRRYPFKRHYFIDSQERVGEALSELLDSLSAYGDEPMVNIALRAVDSSTIEAVVVPRRAHRPQCYDTVKVSPGAVDVFGTLITVSEADFDAVDSSLAASVFNDVAFVSHELSVNVGIMSAPEIQYELHGSFESDAEGAEFRPLSSDSYFTLKDVTIGVDFHWQRKENQSFLGKLKLKKSGDLTLALNIVPVEDYLTSVISSEMSADASLELLKAHAVISRSWVLAQICHKASASGHVDMLDTPEERVKWYDHDDHVDFDVCADDHCQRYQGITRASRAKVRSAILSTWGEVLMYGDELCDARFSKCCGGAFEEFQYCWEPRRHDYLVAARDAVDGAPLPDLTVEANAREWILGRPDAFCADVDDSILAQVLNNYDRETVNFYRWTVDYDVDELSAIVRERSGIDFGEIRDLVPLARGTSGRIYRLKIVGSKRTMIVGKELEIRKWLSRSHLYSSAFVVERTLHGFRLHGAGWGHGVGLCQIGAAVMGERGFNYRQILSHYFKDAEIRSIY